MNVDARISVSLPAHPKTKKLIRRGGQGAAWNLVCLFLWVSQNKPSGQLHGMSVEDIEIAAGWEGEEGKFVQMLSDVGFLDRDEDGHSVHDWEQHNPWACGSERRSENSRIAARKRWGIAESSEKPAKQVRKASESQSGSNPNGNANGCDPHSDPHATGIATSAKSQSPVSVSVSVAESISETTTPPDGGASPSAGSRLPVDWTLPDTWAAEGRRILVELNRSDIQIPLEAEKFRDHWAAQPGQKGRKSDWLGTWRNWVRKSCEFQRGPPAAKPSAIRIGQQEYAAGWGSK